MPVRAAFSLALITIVIAVLASPGAARAHEGPGLLADLGKVTEQLPGGLYVVQPRVGPPLTTHGTDPEPPQGASADDRFGPMTLAGRPPLCTQSRHQRILYGRAPLTPDRRLLALPIIEGSIWRMNAQLDLAARESGQQHADYRVLCDENSRLRVDGFVNPGSASFADVVSAARLAGATDPDVDYTIFYDDATPQGCGTGSLAVDKQPGRENANNVAGGYAVIYSDCWDAATVMHEVGHNQGAVQPAAPNSTGTGGHCRDEADIMCYADGSEGAAGMLQRCEGPEKFDCNYDDYFDAAPEAGEFLASHWNLGSPANEFIVLSPLEGDDAAPVEDECLESASPDCIEDEDAPEDAVRIVGGVVRLPAGRVRVQLACPSVRQTFCSGRLSVRRGKRAQIGRRSFTLDVGARRTFRLAMGRPARRALLAAGTRRVRVVTYEPDEDLSASATLAVRGPAARAARRR